MLRNNVMSFMKKMGMTQQEAGASVTPEESGKTLSKILQLGNIITAGNVTKPAKVTPVDDIQPKEDSSTIESLKPKSETGGKVSSADDCRICRKSFSPEEVSRICCECQHKVCEDCASYSTTTNSDDLSSWTCSVCRRKIASRDQPIVTQDSTDSMLDVPCLEALHRRHSDARLGPTGSQIGTLGSGLAPPRSPEIRRHSDVSPASLKELEKVAGERQREDLRWERDLDRKSKSRGGSPDRHQASDRGRATSPQRVVMPAQTGAIEQEGGDLDDEEERRRRARRGGGTVRRKSRVTRQRSYDDEIKTATTMAAGGAQPTHPDTGLGLPVQLPRRASAYDVYAVPGSSGLNAMAIAAAQQRASISAQGTREPEERARRSSFRAVKPVMPYDAADDEKMIKLDSSSAPAVVPPVSQPVLVPDEERRNRRRGSQLPDINAIRALTSAQPGAVKGGPAAVVSRVAAEERELPRQGSLVDGEGIKIVIHDVDSDPAPRINAKRRVKLRRDPVTDKGHRTRGFGMRVVGGKTGSDGRTFACIVWTVPGGPAEKAGLQQGDKVLEWSGVSLIDRSFEEVQQIIERTDDVAELVVEHTTEITGDLLDDPQSGKTPTNLGLLMETETEKAPSSPTRRKLPKTPEQIAKERQVTGRIQIQVSYEAERKELVVSVFMADDLCVREDTGFGTLPEAFAKLILAPPSGETTPLKTIVAEPTQKPIWNATLFFTGVDGESLMERAIEVTLWDYCPDGDNVFLGECTVDVQRALENDRAVWYRLEDPRGLRSGKSPYCSPRGSVSMEVAQRLFRKELRDRSYSDDTQSDSGSPEFCFLHPDHAWHANSRRGSSQSEQLEVEPYELNRDYSRSLPGSRRSSFQSQGGTDSKRGSMGEADMPAIVHYNRDRRRSSFTRPMRDPEEILEGLRALKATKGGELSRTMSLSSDKRRGSRRGERKDSVMEIPERFYDRNSESDEDEKWSQSARNENGVDLKLGRGQLLPKEFKIISGAQNGEVQLGFYLCKGTLEVEVICARDICPEEKEEPDTYVKTYLRERDGDKWLQKRKTRVVRHSKTPQYRQTLKYGRCDPLQGRHLLVMLWEKKQAFESNQGLGGAEVDLDLLPPKEFIFDWYPLFPIHTLGTHNADSP
ncbi:PREDICTED: regulating synaptic membrane exocytosis protein 1 isoform X2 [Trachymyrmex septentrionalis]|uniref:regulating synaptic membrane exocytosis protein 1 isoform X2 n=1 Tax=Trachymyrmex septentrionalis TaxID=34720 RepID=UPI00084F6849|nr:PREDICTED: regulating synaptic membrane exocytosis protein 1 isoform X2 [Trachymyrmex septentrionalis]